MSIWNESLKLYTNTNKGGRVFQLEFWHFREVLILSKSFRWIICSFIRVSFDSNRVFNLKWIPPNDLWTKETGDPAISIWLVLVYKITSLLCLLQVCICMCVWLRWEIYDGTKEHVWSVYKTTNSEAYRLEIYLCMFLDNSHFFHVLFFFCCCQRLGFMHIYSLQYILFIVTVAVCDGILYGNTMVDGK